MLALIEMQGKQFRVKPETIFYTELTGQEKGSEIEIKSVLMIQNENNTIVGQPYVNSAMVKAKVLGEEKSSKINAFIYKRKKRYHKRWGHRQRYHKIQVTSIQF